ANDKRFHAWGQSESGMGQLVDRLTLPGQLVCDPFLGGGTTAVACLRLGRRFVGCDINAEALKMARLRAETTELCANQGPEQQCLQAAGELETKAESMETLCGEVLAALHANLDTLNTIALEHLVGQWQHRFEVIRSQPPNSKFYYP